MKSRVIVVWMNQPSHYQTAFFHQLASRPGILLRVFYASGLSAERRALGWAEPETAKYPQAVLRTWVDAATMAWQYKNAIHLINGMWSVPIFIFVSTILLSLGAKVFFHAEQPTRLPAGRQRWRTLKQCLARALFMRARGLFAIGKGAELYYRQLGVPQKQIYRFSYFCTSRPDTAKPRTEARVSVLYVGQFIERKCVGDLIEAFARFAAAVPNASLLLVGEGPLKLSYQVIAEKLGIAERTEILGPVSPDRVSGLLSKSHMLVLPSEFDGWGITVNEALQVGVPVVVSTECGAAEVVAANPSWGIVFPARNVAALSASLVSLFYQQLRVRPDPRQVLETIGPARMTKYFCDCVEYALEPRNGCVKPRLKW